MLTAWTEKKLTLSSLRFARSFVRPFVRMFVRSFFVRPFTPRGWLRSARNFAKTRFRRCPTFDFWPPKNFFRWNFRTENEASNQKWFVLGELRFFERLRQILHEKSPHFPRISSHYVPWRRGSKTSFDFFVDFWPKTDLHFFFEDDDMMIWWFDMMIWWYGDVMIWWYDDGMMW